MLLVLPRTYDPATGKYGNVYSNLLDYVISAVFLFYILTVLGLFRLRFIRPNAERPYRAARISRSACVPHSVHQHNIDGVACVSADQLMAGARNNIIGSSGLFAVAVSQPAWESGPISPEKGGDSPARRND